MKIILGSASKRRRKILEKMNYDFEVMISDIDEKTIRFKDPKKLTMALAKAKAEVLLLRIKEPALLITADQVVLCNQEILEKPKNAKEARRFLQGYTKYPAQPINAIVVTNIQTGKQIGENDSNIVYFKPFPDKVIEQLIAKGNVFSQAGGFSIEDSLIKPYIDHIKGTRDSIGGLPKELTERLIRGVQ